MGREKLKKIQTFLSGEALLAEPLAKHTYFRIGGKADLVALPEDRTDLKNLLSYLNREEITYRILGNGSNLLVSDRGVSGVVIKLSKLKEIKIKKNQVTAEAGVKLPLLARKVAEASLSGLEFAIGIPATVGGAVVMNAGAYGSEISELITEVETCTKKGEIKKHLAKDLDFSYRKSHFKKSDEVILKIGMSLKLGDSTLIKSKMDSLLAKRKKSQPLSFPNAGCIFKNPPNDSAGRLIDSAGVKGLKIGGAMVSRKHANFIVNTGSATAEDVFSLVDKVRQLVYDKFDVSLEEEINFWSDSS